MTFDQWKKEWKDKRAAQFTFIGSKDETFGNQSCTYDLENHLRMRVFSKDEEVLGNYVTLKMLNLVTVKKILIKRKFLV